MYVNVGQEPALLRRRATGEIVALNPTGPVLGVDASSAFKEVRVKLFSGDVVALFTDGLTEAGVDRRNLLEIEGVTEIFRASTEEADTAPIDIINQMIGRVTAAVTPAGIRDDVCLLVACVA